MIIRNGASALVSNAKPSYEYGQPAALMMKSTVTNLFFHFGLPSDLRKGATVLSATVRLPQSGGPWPGGRTMTLRRVDVPGWSVGRINWNNQPGVVTGSSTGVTTTDTPFGYVWEFTGAGIVADVQAWVNSGVNWGWRLATSDTVGRFLNSFKASANRPTLEITYAYLPAKPTTLNPSAGAVGIAKPVVSWDSADLSACQVQIDPGANGTSPAFDSGTVVTTDQQLDLSLFVGSSLVDGASTQWRVRITDNVGQVSPWSTWATYSRVAHPTLSITSPTTVVSDSSPVIDWTFTGQNRYRVLIAEAASPTKFLYDTGVVPSTATEHTVNKAVVTKVGTSYKFIVRAWDAVVRDVTSGDPDYTEAAVTVPLSYDPTVTAVSWIAVDQASPAPWLDIKWSRASQPDGWMIERDGVPIFTTATASDLLVSGTVYQWRDWTAEPNWEHVYRVAAVTNGLTARGGPTEAFTPVVSGIWLADPDTGLEAVLWGDDEGTWVTGEDSTVYLPIGADAPVRVTHSMRGLEGTLTGLILDTDNAPDYPSDAVEAALYLMKANPAQVVRLVAGDINIPVVLNTVTVAPSPLTNVSQRVKNVMFGFEQSGELPYTAVL